MKRIALLGPGTFSEESVFQFLGRNSFDYINYKSISDVFFATAIGETDYSVIPIENTIKGSVSEHIDILIHEIDIPIQVEWIHSIDMNLIGFPVSKFKPFAHINKVLSYPVAITQCREFLREHLNHAEIVQSSSTAEGIRLVKEWNDPNCVAIGARAGAELNGLEVLSEKIQDHRDNHTRFILIGKSPLKIDTNGLIKTTILVTPPEDYPGALHQVLSAFSWRKINLSHIESMPTKKKLGNYYFYIDIEGSTDSILLTLALQEIEAIGCQVRILGCYPSFNLEYNSTPMVGVG